MRMSIINVGYGDSILMQMSDGYTILLDGGSALEEEFADDAFRIRSAEYLQRQSVKHLDLLIISHIHEDHVCGLEQVLHDVTVDRIWIPYSKEIFGHRYGFKASDSAPRNVHYYTKSLNAFQSILDMAKERGILVETVKAGEEKLLAQELKVFILAPNENVLKSYTEIVKELEHSATDEAHDTKLLTQLDAMSNATSFLLRLETEGVNFLCAADNVPSGWSEVPSFMLKNVNVLKLPHHGQRDAVNTELMRDMQLTHVITTSGSDRRYNSSNKEVYEKLVPLGRDGKPPVFLFSDEREYPPFFSQPDGFQAIVLETDSGEINVTFQKI